MKKIAIMVLFASLSATAQAQLINDVSEYLLDQSLYIVRDGELAPRQDNDGATVANFLPNQTCSSSEPEKCDGMLFSYRKANLNECIKPTMAYRFDELPVNLVKGGLGIFTVPSITEPESKSHDYLVFFSTQTNTCYEVNWGFDGQQFDKAVNLANQIINLGY